VRHKTETWKEVELNFPFRLVTWVASQEDQETEQAYNKDVQGMGLRESILGKQLL
jgi:hypothetical protein